MAGDHGLSEISEQPGVPQPLFCGALPRPQRAQSEESMVLARQFNCDGYGESHNIVIGPRTEDRTGIVYGQNCPETELFLG
jgi:hypothetical protein